MVKHIHVYNPSLSLGLYLQEGNVLKANIWPLSTELRLGNYYSSDPLERGKSILAVQ